MITIIDYGSGNINAIKNIYERLNISCEFAVSIDQIEKADHIILPGVGAFDETISTLRAKDFFNVLNKRALIDKVPILGICVGMQMLADSSEEGTLNGLGWIPGKVKKFDKNQILNKPKIPHLGWNSVEITKENPLFNGIDAAVGFYFVHSYYYECYDEANVIAECEYGKVFHASINHENIFGVQFHPEKSHENGIQLLKNFSML
jgi:imidazole glycerol phosphate synthase, glutamine amidotransferase subunit